jgi:gliding motility-associated-like protein
VTAYLPTDEYGFNDISLSNQVMVQQMPNTYIPNAFTPQGEVNNVFLPANTFVSGEQYNLRIYARTGELIFLSRDPNIGWDGTARGKPCPTGVYIYKLTYSRPDGTLFEKTGTVTLIR